MRESFFPLLSVIPTFVLLGPLALLAALFPALFAGLGLFWRRWGVLLGVASLNSTLYVAHGWFRGHAEGAWWGAPQELWSCLAAVACVGAILSFRRAKAALRSGPTDAGVPGRVLLPVLAVASLLGLAAVVHGWRAGFLLRAAWREGLPALAAIWTGAIFLAVDRLRRAASPGVAAAMTEAAMLGTLAAGSALVAITVAPLTTPQVVWTFEAVERGVILSKPLVAGDRVYISAAHATVQRPFGAVYCLDRRTGKRLWTFNRAGTMKQALSSPALDSGRLYVGEGLHEDTDCGLYCLDAGTGQQVWRFATGSHTESSPRVADGWVYFGAGDDGVYCLDAEKGTQRWRFAGLHVDATPALVGDRLFAGSGYGQSEMFCLERATGRPVWRTPSELSVFGSPVADAGQVFFGVGNGKLNRSSPHPAGALVCLDAATGKRLWRYDVADAVLGTPALDRERVCFGARDRHCYGLDRRDGRLHWKRDLESPVVAGPMFFAGRLYAIAGGGNVACLDPQSGASLWQFDVARHSRTAPEMVSSPAFSEDAESGLRLYVGAGLQYSISYAAVVYCLKPPG